MTKEKEDLDNKEMSYSEYVKYLLDHNWYREKITIHELNSVIVNVNKLKAKNEGTVIDIMCPPGRIMSINGKKDSNTDISDEIIKTFEVRLTDSNKVDIDPDTDIKILKRRILRKDTELYKLKYRDISVLDYSDSDNMFKTYEDLYRFENNIELKGEDHLKIYVINPDIDIDIIKFNLGLDLWTSLDI